MGEEDLGFPLNSLEGYIQTEAGDERRVGEVQNGSPSPPERVAKQRTKVFENC